MEFAIFTKGKDWFLYPNVNLIPAPGTLDMIKEWLNIDDLLYNLKEYYISECQSDSQNKSTIETIKEFDDKYEILFKLKNK